jgi:hypothetical protein
MVPQPQAKWRDSDIQSISDIFLEIQQGSCVPGYSLARLITCIMVKLSVLVVLGGRAGEALIVCIGLV